MFWVESFFSSPSVDKLSTNKWNKFSNGNRMNVMWMAKLDQRLDSTLIENYVKCKGCGINKETTTGQKKMTKELEYLVRRKNENETHLG